MNERAKTTERNETSPRARYGTLAAAILLTAAGCTSSTAAPGAAPGAARDAGPAKAPGGGRVPLPAADGEAGATGANTCAADPTDDTCTACLKSTCCDTLSACVNETPCVALIQCGNGCASGDTTCGDPCVSANPAGESSALALVSCEQSSCASACSATSAAAPSAGGSGACLPDSTIPASSPDCAGLADTPVEHDCPFGAPNPSCVAAPNGATNVFCCPSGAGVPPAGGPSAGGTTGSVDPQVVGVWENSNTSGVDYTNGSGAFSSPSGNKAIFEFAADGEYLFEDFMQSSLYSCTMAVLGRESGTASFHGGGFTLSPSSAAITSQDSCNASNNYQKPWQNRLNGPFEYTWSIGPDPAGSGRRMLSITFLGDGSSENLLEQPQP